MESNLQTIHETSDKPNFISELGWFFSGVILPIGSLGFYRKASQKSVSIAILFFFIFTSSIACLLTISLAVTMYSVSGGIKEAYANGKIPEIVIENGIAQVEGKQPNILLSGQDAAGESVFVAIDTSGEITRIDESLYDTGFLLTRTQLHVLSNGDYQVLPLIDLNRTFEQPRIEINAQTVQRGWQTFLIIFVVFAFVFIWLWHVILRLMIISLIALLIWGMVSIIRPNTGFGPIIISGLYAIVPAIYLSHLLSRSVFTFPGVQTFFLIIFWAVALVASLSNSPFLTTDRPLRLWTALIGLPMLIIFIVDFFRIIPDPYGVISIWVITMLTIFTIIGIRLFFRYQDNQKKSNQTPAETQN